MENPSLPNAPEQPIDNVTSATWRYLGTHFLPYIILYLVVAVAVFYFVPDIGKLQIGVALIVGGGTFFYTLAYSKIKREFTQEFGKSIGFTYTPKAELNTVSGKLFATGHSQYIFDVLSGLYRGHPMRIFSLRFIIGYGKGSQTFKYTVFESLLAGTVPDILLMSNQHMSAVSDWFSGDKTVELEGDFNKYFKLRVPKGREQEAYQIFTPDVMANLIDKASGVSFEFIGDKLYLYATKIVTKRTELQSMFDLSEYLVELFEKNTAMMRV